MRRSFHPICCIPIFSCMEEEDAILLMIQLSNNICCNSYSCYNIFKSSNFLKLQSHFKRQNRIFLASAFPFFEFPIAVPLFLLETTSTPYEPILSRIFPRQSNELSLSRSRSRHRALCNSSYSFCLCSLHHLWSVICRKHLVQIAQNLRRTVHPGTSPRQVWYTYSIVEPGDLTPILHTVSAREIAPRRSVGNLV